MAILYQTAKYIFLQWQFGAQPPNLISANISGYTLFAYLKAMCKPELTSVLWGTAYQFYLGAQQESRCAN